MEPNRFKGTWLGKGKNVPKAVICRARDIGARDPEPTSAELWVGSSA